MNSIPKYNPNELAADIAVKHTELLTEQSVHDITTAIKEAFGDGYCRGYNDASEIKNKSAEYLQWWEEMDEELTKSDVNDLEEYYRMSGNFEKDLQECADELLNSIGEDEEIYGDVPNVPKEFFEAKKEQKGE